MILGNLKVKHPEIKLLPKSLQSVFKFMENCQFGKLPVKKYNLLGEKIFLVINEYETQKPKDKRAEQHREYLDIQYVISGQEAIGIGYHHPDNQTFYKYNPEKDNTSYTTIKNETYIYLKKGMYAILFPEDIHRPGLDYEGTQKVKKAVIKFDKSLLTQEKIKLQKITSND